MSNDITVTVRGFCGTSAKLNEAEGRRPWAQFRLASTPSIRTPEGGWRDGETTWLTVKTFGNLAKNVGVSVRKSDAVIVVGRLRTERWTGEDGQERESLVIVADSVGADLAFGHGTFTRVTDHADAPGQRPASDAGPGSAGDDVDRRFETPDDATGADAGPEQDVDPDLEEIEADRAAQRELAPAF